MNKNRLFSCLGLLCFLLSVSAKANLSPLVSFSASPSSGCAPLPVTFTNHSLTGNYFAWDFKDGSPIVYALNTSHTFQNSGNYMVTLNAFDTTGHGMMPKGAYQMSINVQGSTLYLSEDTVCPGQMVSYDLYPNGNNYNWSFGDGGTSSNTNPSHSYSNVGVDTIKLTVSLNGCGTVTLKKIITVKNGAKPNARFSVNPYSACPTDPILFYPSEQYGTVYSWTFGDGGTSTQSQPSHSYAGVGKYVVKLTLTSSCGTSSTYTDTARISGNVHFNNNIQIQANMNTACPADPINFFFNNQVPASKIVWKFGSTGDSALSANPTYAFATAGTYTVTAKLFNGCGNDTTVSKIITITNNLPYQGNAQMQIYPNPACPNDQVNFGSNPAKAYKWYFGDVANDSSSMAQPHFSYPSVGTYTVSLKLYNGCGKDTLIKSAMVINNSVMPQLSHTGNNNNWGSPAMGSCPGDTVIFYAQLSGNLHWDFGDGSSTNQSTPIPSGNGGTAYIVKHAFATNGTYNVKLTVTNSCNNSASDSLSYTVLSTSPVNGSINILGNSNNNSNFNTCTSVGFIAAGGLHYKWYFGNGDSLITDKSLIYYSYKTAGSFTVTLKVTNGCGNSATYTKSININGMMTTLVATKLMCNGAGNGQLVAGVSSGGYHPYVYSVNGGPYFSSGTFQNLTAGTYTVSYKDSVGCLVSSMATLTQPSQLMVTASSTNSSCGGATGSASVVASGGTPAYTYSWQGGATTSSISSIASGSYAVKVTDANGCIFATNIAVSDNAGPTVTFSNTIAPVCVNATSFTLTGGSPGGGTYFGTGVSAGQFYSPSVAGAGTHTITYTYTTGGCTGSATNTVTVNPLPHLVIASNPANAQVCTGSSLILTGTGAGTYSWSGGITNGTPFVPGGSATYTVTGTDANNCAANSNIAVTVNSLPVVGLNFVGHDTLMDCGQAVNLTGGTPAGGMYSGPHVVNNSFSPSSAGAGVYTITYTFTNAAGCSASKSTSLHVLACPTGIQPYATNSFKMYPNPSNGLLFVETPGQTGTLEILNLVGQVVLSHKVTLASEALNLNAQSNGVYLIRFTDANGTAVQRLIISK